jgi:phosphatidylglycerol---prolipoprotein diacylglyceryl transferase
VISALASIGWPVLDRIRLGDSIAISPHGLGIAIGFMIGASLLTRIGPPRLVPDDATLTPEELAARRAEVRSSFEKMIFWALVGTIIGSRLFYVIAHYSEFDGLGDMLAIWRGGISLLGGIAGAVLINVPRMRRLGWGFFRTMDPAVVCIALGIGIGRVGDLIIGDHLGKPTSWLLAWTYQGGTLAPPWVCANDACSATLQDGSIETITRGAATLVDAHGKLLSQGVGVHQTALYDMISAWLLFALLWYLASRPRRLGVLTLTFGLWYGTMRVVEDSLRIDKRFFGLTGSQWTGATVAVLSAATLIAWAIAKGPGPALEPVASSDREGLHDDHSPPLRETDDGADEGELLG